MRTRNGQQSFESHKWVKIIKVSDEVVLKVKKGGQDKEGIKL